MQGKARESRSTARAQDLPGPVLEQVLAHVPFHERVQATAVCRAWRQHLAQRGLPLWQAVSIEWDHGKWYSAAQPKYVHFLSLRDWLQHHGRGLLQLQCCTSFGAVGGEDDHLLDAFVSYAGVAPSLQALRLDGSAARGLTNRGLASFGRGHMGGSLRQLALIELQRVDERALGSALAGLPMLQDLAIIFANKQEAGDASSGEDVEDEPWNTDIMLLLADIAPSCLALQTLAVGNLWHASSAELPLVGRPLPAVMSRLTALSSLMLHNVGWEHAPGGLPHLPQLRRLSLKGDGSGFGELRDAVSGSSVQTELRHQLSTLTGLGTLQATLPDWPGRLPPNLTHLVLLPEEYNWKRKDRDEGCASFLRFHFPPLCGLRHLAFHHLHEVGDRYLRDVCAAAKALPQLVTLHLVDCNVCDIPVEMCELSQLQMLNLSENLHLHAKGCNRLAQAPLHKLAACRQLDLQCDDIYYSHTPMQPDTIAAIAAMPALRRLALPVTEAYAPKAASPEELAQLKRCRAPGLPPIRVVTSKDWSRSSGPAMPDLDRWARVTFEMPFAETNDVLGVQLDRRIL